HSAGGHAMQFGLTKGQLVVWTWIVIGIILLLVYLFMRKKEVGVPSKLQNLGEAIVEAIISLLEPNLGHDMTRRLLPLFGTFLIFILVSNVFLIIPEGQPPTSDLSTTLALACIALFTAHFLNFKFNGFKDSMKRWFNPQPELTKREKLPDGARMGAKIGSLFKFGLTWVIVGLLIAFHLIDNGARLLFIFTTFWEYLW
ncbi:MAG: F0F1 ATP synthase subunit A, partial [bacterium]